MGRSSRADQQTNPGMPESKVSGSGAGSTVFFVE